MSYSYFPRILVAAGLAATAVNASTAYYTLTDLGTDGLGQNPSCKGMNNRGQVVAQANNALSHSHAYLYTNGLWLDLGAVGGADGSAWPVGISDSGEVACYGSIPTDYHLYPLLYANGTMQNMGLSSSNDNQGLVFGINNSNQVIGYVSGADTGGGYQRPFIYRAGVWAILPALGSDRFALPLGINDSGRVVGYSGNGSAHAFLYANGITTDLGANPVSGFPNSEAVAINNSGMIIGNVSADNYFDVPSTHAAIFTNGNIIDLNPLIGEDTSMAVAVSPSGQALVTGYTRWGYQYVGTSYLYQNGAVTRLDDLVDPALGYDVAGVAFNNAGQILANGVYNYYYSACVLLTPPSASQRPSLSTAMAGKKLVVFWPASATNFVLETGARIGTGASWSAVTNGIISAGGFYFLTNSMTNAATFFRLRQP